MLYSIIPPIIVILSFIGVIVFLLKKAPRVADLRELGRREISESNLENAGFLKRMFAKVGSFFRLRFKIWLWAFLEKMTRKSRMLFLKLESSSGRISSRIREKKNNKKIEAETEKNETIEIEEEKKEIVEEKKDAYDFSYLRRKPKENLPKVKEEKTAVEEVEEKPVKPMISDKVVSPRSRSEIKDILEDVLIERIAANPKDIEAYERLGEYYMEIGNYDHAKECIRQVLKLDPTNRNAKYKMKRLERLITG